MIITMIWGLMVNTGSIHELKDKKRLHVNPFGRSRQNEKKCFGIKGIF